MILSFYNLPLRYLLHSKTLEFNSFSGFGFVFMQLFERAREMLCYYGVYGRTEFLTCLRFLYGICCHAFALRFFVSHPICLIYVIYMKWDTASRCGKLISLVSLRNTAVWSVPKNCTFHRFGIFYWLGACRCLVFWGWEFCKQGYCFLRFL